MRGWMGVVAVAEADGIRQTLTKSQARYIEVYAETLAALPRDEFHSSETFRDDPAVEMPYAALHAGTKRSMMNKGLLTVVETRRMGGCNYNIWRVPDDVLDRAQEYVDDSDTPVPGCPHRGLRNLGDGEYTCCNDDCDNSCSREEVEL